MAGSVPGQAHERGNQLMFLSLPSPFSKINKHVIRGSCKTYLPPRLRNRTLPVYHKCAMCPSQSNPPSPPPSLPYSFPRSNRILNFSDNHFSFSLKFTTYVCIPKNAVCFCLFYTYIYRHMYVCQHTVFCVLFLLFHSCGVCV